MKKYKIPLLIFAVIIILSVSGIFSAVHYTNNPAFCGSCHMMKKYYDSWKNSIHGEKKVACVECHYIPDGKHTANGNFRGLGQILSYLSLAGPEVRSPAKINDLSCSASGCHLVFKKAKFKEKISFVHITHIDKTIEGQPLHCDICHRNVTAEKHFEVSGEICFLCHFINKNFNKGLARCSLCHVIPSGPIQRSSSGHTEVTWPAARLDENSITHESLEKAKVPCQSCHYEIVRGNGEVRKQKCLACHNNSFKLETAAGEKKLVSGGHATGTHAAGQYAKCFDCHEPVRHEEIEFTDPVIESCFVCHPDHHKYQKILLLESTQRDMIKMPGLMYDVKTNCIGCHIDEKTQKGEKVIYGSARACGACHTKKQEAMVEEWKNGTKQELGHAKTLEKKAQDAIRKAKGKVSEETIGKAAAMLKEGHEGINIVEYGGGFHNRRFSVRLLDSAMDNFEDIVDLLK
ncbi:MAG: NapC/NirT family cytochrome c [Nitrospirae bacterium]|nr:NapC/NirT family cytochrome c [Nitrospirota bacterium]